MQAVLTPQPCNEDKRLKLFQSHQFLQIKTRQFIVHVLIFIDTSHLFVYYSISVVKPVRTLLVHPIVSMW